MTKDELRGLIRQHLHDDGAAIEWLWPVIVDFVAEWIIGRPGLLPVQPEDLAHRWREEMGMLL